MTSTSDSARQFLRHSVATVAYRGGKALRDAPNHFSSFHIGDKTRTPRKSSPTWATYLIGRSVLRKVSRPGAIPSPSLGTQNRALFAAMKKFDDYLASAEPLHGSAEGLFQGPVADALNHVGQIAMLRRLAGSPILGENYFRADVAAGRVGLEQSAPHREFE